MNEFYENVEINKKLQGKEAMNKNNVLGRINIMFGAYNRNMAEIPTKLYIIIVLTIDYYYYYLLFR